MRLPQRKFILTKDEITLKKKIQTTHENYLQCNMNQQMWKLVFEKLGIRWSKYASQILVFKVIKEIQEEIKCTMWEVWK